MPLRFSMAAPLLATFEQVVVGKTCVIERQENIWTFSFGGAHIDRSAVSGGCCLLTTETLWRLVDVKRLAVTSADDGQLFGLAVPLDAQQKLRTSLYSATVVSAAVDPRTADIALIFDTGARLEIITTSCGYESWQAYFIDGDQDVVLIGSGSGLSVASSPAGSKPAMLVGRPLEVR